MSTYYEDRINLSANLPYPSILAGSDEMQKEADMEVEQQVASGDYSNLNSWLESAKKAINTKTTSNDTLNNITKAAVSIYNNIYSYKKQISDAERKAEIDAYLDALRELLDEAEDRLDDTRQHKWLLFGGVNAACILLGTVLYITLKK